MADKNSEEEIFFPEDDNLGADDIDTSAVEDAAAADAAQAEAEAEVEAEETTNDGESELEKRYMALYAEYENYRKRSTKEKENLYADAIASVTGQWLTVLDNIERAMDSAQKADENTIAQVIEGIERIGKQATDILTKLGVEEIEVERGTKFDPNLHEAVMHLDDPDLGEQEVAMVFQKGYIYKERVVRHAVVQVAN